MVARLVVWYTNSAVPFILALRPRVFLAADETFSQCSPESLFKLVQHLSFCDSKAVKTNTNMHSSLQPPHSKHARLQKLTYAHHTDVTSVCAQLAQTDVTSLCVEDNVI